MLMDTGAIKMCINENILKHLKNLEFISQKYSPFILADDIVQFSIFGQVRRSTRFNNVNTVTESSPYGYHHHI